MGEDLFVPIVAIEGHGLKVVKRADLTPDAIAYRIDRMNRAVPSALTFNLRDFPAIPCEPYGIEAVDPDTFDAASAGINPARVQAALGDIAQRRTRPAMTVHELLDRLATVLPVFVGRVRAAPPDPT